MNWLHTWSQVTDKRIAILGFSFKKDTGRIAKGFSRYSRVLGNGQKGKFAAVSSI